MANLTAGWLMFWCLLWLCWATCAPVVADAYRERYKQPAQHLCPMLQMRHGIGGDLRTYTRVKDLCADG